MGRKSNNQRYGRIGSVPTLMEVLEEHYDLLTEAEKKRLFHRYALHPHTQKDILTAIRLSQSIQTHLSSKPVDKNALYQRIVARINRKEYSVSSFEQPHLSRWVIFPAFVNDMIEKWRVWLYFFKKKYNFWKTKWTTPSIGYNFSFPRLSPALALFSVAFVAGGLYWFTNYGFSVNKKKAYHVTQLSMTGSMWIGEQFYQTSPQEKKFLKAEKKTDSPSSLSQTKSISHALNHVHKHGSLRMSQNSFAMIHVCQQVEMFLTGSAQVGIHCAESGFRAGQKQFKIGNGLVHFQVPPQKAGEEVIIQQPFYQMNVIGTRFIIQEEKHFSRMILLEGSVKIKVKKAKNSKQNGFIVKAGTIITLYHTEEQVVDISWHLVDLDKYAAFVSDQHPDKESMSLAERNIFQLLRPFMELPQIISHNAPFFVQWERKPNSKDGVNVWELRNGEISAANQDLYALFSSVPQGLNQKRLGQVNGQNIFSLPEQDLHIPKKSTMNQSADSVRTNLDERNVWKQNENRFNYQSKKPLSKRNTFPGVQKSQSNTEIDKGLFNQKNTPLDKTDKSGETTVTSAGKKAGSTQKTVLSARKNLSQTAHKPALFGKSTKQADMATSKPGISKESKKTSNQNFTTPRILESSHPDN